MGLGLEPMRADKPTRDAIRERITKPRPGQRGQVELPPRQKCPECGAPAKEWWPIFSPEPEGWVPDGRGFFVCTSGHHYAWFHDARPVEGDP